MKKIYLLILFILSVGFSYAQNITLFHGIATGTNVTMDFDDANSTVGVDIDSFQNNVCGLGEKGFLVTGYVDTQSVGYTYYNEDDGNTDFNSCSAIILSGKDFIFTGVGYIESDDEMNFDNIRLLWDNTNKVYYLSGNAITNKIGQVDHWDNVYVSGLNLIDWSNTIVDYSECTGDNYANGDACNVNIHLLDVAGNDVVVLNNITGTIVSVSDNLDNLVYISTGADIEKSFNVTDGIFKVPLYILKAVENGEVKIKFSYSMPDIDGNNEYVLDLTGINLNNPFKDINIDYNLSPIVGENIIVTGNALFLNTGNILSYTLTGNLKNIDSLYEVSNSTITGNVKQFIVYPRNFDITKSVVNLDIAYSGLILKFKNFDKEVSYSINKIKQINIYANKKVDYNKSFTGLSFNNIFSGADIENSPKVKPILRDSNGYAIPDVSFNITFKDEGNENTYSGWDCDEINVGYQAGCNDLQFVSDSNVYKGTIDGKNGGTVVYKTLGDSNYSDISIVSYKPVSGGKLSFIIDNYKNTDSNWNFQNSGDYLNIDNNYTGEIGNLSYKPYFLLGLNGLGDQNFVDINNEISFYIENSSSIKVDNISFNLSGTITKPTDSNLAKFVDGGILTGENIVLDSRSKKDLLLNLLFDIDFYYNDAIEFNYNKGSYKLSSSQVGLGAMTLKPWSFWFGDLKAINKLAGVYVNGLISRIQKYTTSVKTFLGRGGTSKNIDTSFVKTYNKLYKKAVLLSKGISENSSINISSLKGGVKYISCYNNNILTIGTGYYRGNNLVVVKNCRILIKGNIMKTDSTDSLVIFAYNEDNNTNFNDISYLDNKSNIFIADNVSDIEAGLITKGSIITIKGDIISDSNILMSNRQMKIVKKQLYINGMLISKNNIGGGIITNGNIYIGNNYKLSRNNFIDTEWNKWGNINSFSDILPVSELFDLNFARGIKYISGNTYDPSWYSTYCDSGNKQELGCKYPLYIKYDPILKNNILFKF